VGVLPLSQRVPPNGKYRALLLVAPVVSEALLRWSPYRYVTPKALQIATNSHEKMGNR
jgi:hypothetical protein